MNNVGTIIKPIVKDLKKQLLSTNAICRLIINIKIYFKNE